MTGSQPTCLKAPENELTQLTSISPQLELDVPSSEHDMLNKVDLSRCDEWNLKDQQEVKKF